MRDFLETHQIWIYFAALGLGALAGLGLPGIAAAELALTPALGGMLWVTFLQVPLAELRRSLAAPRFLGALMLANFALLPVLVLGLLSLAPQDPVLRLGITMVLLAPCIDYVITFTHLGGGDAKRLLAATPLLLLAQIVMLPLTLALLLGEVGTGWMQPGPFVQAFLLLILLPLVAAGLVQRGAARRPAIQSLSAGLGLLPVPATALVLFLVSATSLPVLEEAKETARAALPYHIAFAALAPLLGWAVARGFRLAVPEARAVAFSTGTRNALVLLPLALAVPGHSKILAAILVTQTLVELVAELIYIRLLPRLIR